MIVQPLKPDTISIGSSSRILQKEYLSLTMNDDLKGEK